VNILRFDSDPSWLNALTSLWRDRLRLNPGLRHCLASGNTPIPIYRAMAQSAKRGEVSFRKATVFALDEFGGLAATDEGRCRNMLKRDLIDDVELPEAQFYCFDPDVADLAGECKRFDGAAGKGFDLVLLGIGLNGHLGMNEPGSAQDSPTRRVDLHASTISSSAKYLTHQLLPTWGLTVGMQQFFDSREVWLVATGAAKADVVEKTVRGKITPEVPASLLRRHPNCSLFVDAAAGGRLLEG
jgi:galactosamine-6-phosphate isomerase